MSPNVASKLSLVWLSFGVLGTSLALFSIVQLNLPNLLILGLALGLVGAVGLVLTARSGAARQEPRSAERGAIAVNGLSTTPAADHAGEIVNRLLRLTRAQAEGHKEVVDVGELLSEVARLTAPRWREQPLREGRSISVHVEAPPGLLIEGEPTSLREAMVNLVFNAVDALPEGGGIRLGAWHEGTTIGVEVADTGVGMSADVAERVFEPLSSTAAEPGRGLGLPLVFGLIEANGGTIKIDSAPGMGTTVRLNLRVAHTASQQPAQGTELAAQFAHDIAGPLGVVLSLTDLLRGTEHGLTADGRDILEDVYQSSVRATDMLKALRVRIAADDPATDLAATAPADSRPPVPGAARGTVLIADDDAAIRRAVSATLSADYVILEAADGQEAWRMIREHQPMVAVLDWEMPFHTGIELSAVIKGDPRLDSTTVILLTGRGQPADRIAGAQSRADVYLTKPFSRAALLAAVRQAVAARLPLAS